jgi:hypothetical protein
MTHEELIEAARIEQAKREAKNRRDKESFRRWEERGRPPSPPPDPNEFWGE